MTNFIHLIHTDLGEKPFENLHCCSDAFHHQWRSEVVFLARDPWNTNADLTPFSFIETTDDRNNGICVWLSEREDSYTHLLG